MANYDSKSADQHNQNISAANVSKGTGRSLPAVPVLQRTVDTVQLAVSPSAIYTPVGNALVQIALLDAQVAGAEQTANTLITAPPHGHIHTPTQAAYINAPSAAGWGYCVEEQLNGIAVGMGWNTQVQLANSRPDYYKNVGGLHVFADLTSVAQAGPAGGHITAKLNVSAPNGIPPGNWKGADITHASLNPLQNGHHALVNYNGVVTILHMNVFQQYHNFCNNPNAVWDPHMGHLYQYYGHVSQASFTQTWDENDRDLFVQRFQQQPVERHEPLEYNEGNDMDEESDSNDFQNSEPEEDDYDSQEDGDYENSDIESNSDDY